MFDELIRGLRRLEGAQRISVSMSYGKAAAGNGRVRMTSEEFVAGNWIDGLARALRSLAEAQESYLQDFRKHFHGVLRTAWRRKMEA